MRQAHTGGTDPDTASPERLSAVDLNLLVAFDALARERNVTRAAHRVGVTQSAMSHALRRLRDLFDDPLLVRGQGGMALTPRAEALVVPLRSGLVTLGRALAQPAGFDPATAARTFTLATVDLFDVLVIPALLARVRAEAPSVDLAVTPTGDRRLADQLETGEVDAAIMPRVDADEPARAGDSDDGGPGLLRRRLFRDGFTCLLRADHPALAGARGRRATALSLAAYAGLSHVLVSPTGAGPGLVDRALARHGLARRIALRIPHFWSALAIIARSDLVLTAPTALARFVAGDRAIAAVPPPLRLPAHDVHLVWHARFTSDPGHRWLRERVAAVARDLDDGEGRASRAGPR